MQVKLKSSDGKRFTLTKSQAFCSTTLRTMIESYQTRPNASAEVINLQKVHSDILTKVVSWCQMHHHHENDSDSFGNSDATCKQNLEPYDLTDWDKTFLKSLSEDNLFRLTHAANYLNVPSLLDACCKTIAKSWEGKKVEEIRRMYRIENDFAPDEEHQMLMESKKLGLDN